MVQKHCYERASSDNLTRSWMEPSAVFQALPTVRFMRSTPLAFSNVLYATCGPRHTNRTRV